ncbi:hypothetical protein [Roseovarius indicus]|uniref:Uncharacterized protein n=1 Tax=Roseovarius indicus TaxID=540747 RepID=A0A5P3AD65_9RHOB|nr:hypothetical protein [Roseovarius indicus]QEW26716.1 hypothetical protein RIdsm_02518 [Roseovarius indicus]SFD61183.1 hypothetical protein SAMN04488031_101824 [Roseovarius indicus]
MTTPLHKKLIPYLETIARTQSIAEAQREAMKARELICRETGE